MKYIKVKDEPSLVRDPTNNAILANDLKTKQRFLDEQKKQQLVENLPKRLEEIEKNMANIQNLLNLLINRVDETMKFSNKE